MMLSIWTSINRMRSSMCGPLLNDSSLGKISSNIESKGVIIRKKKGCLFFEPETDKAKIEKIKSINNLIQEYNHLSQIN